MTCKEGSFSFMAKFLLYRYYILSNIFYPLRRIFRRPSPATTLGRLKKLGAMDLKTRGSTSVNDDFVGMGVFGIIKAPGRCIQPPSPISTSVSMKAVVKAIFKDAETAQAAMAVVEGSKSRLVMYAGF